jgi:hypothetical protein
VYSIARSRADELRSCALYSEPDAISRWIPQRSSIAFPAVLGKSATETLAVITQAFGDESKVKSMLIIFFDIRGIVDKELLLADQSVSSA